MISSLRAFVNSNPTNMFKTTKGLFSPFSQRLWQVNSFRTVTTKQVLFEEPSLTQDQLQFQESIHNFCRKTITPELAAQTDREDNCPNLRSIWKQIGQLGLHGVTAPTQYGGLALGYFEHCLAMEVMSQYSASIALSYAAHSNLTINQLSLNGNGKQKETYLPKLIDGTYIGSQAMSESGAGSDILSMKTNAVKKGDYYILNGTKFWITNGPEADVMLVYARTSPTGLTVFLVEKGVEGFSVSKKIKKMGMRGSPTAELVFQDVKVHESAVVGSPERGTYVMMRGLDYERLILAAGPLGLMQRACDIAFDYAHQRNQFKQQVAKFQIMQAKMADMYTETTFCRSALYLIARNLDNHVAASKQKHLEKTGTTPYTAKCASVILKCAEVATKLTNEAVQILGGNGYTEDYEASRLYRDAKIYEIGAGTSEIRRWLIGREINKAYAE